MPVPAIIEVDGKDRGPNLPATIPVQFNPPEYTLAKAAQIAEIAIPGIDAPILQFVRGQTQTLALELFFDTTRVGSSEAKVLDVRLQTDVIAQLGRIQPHTHAPPRIRFVCGLGLSFRAIVDNVQQKFTLFNPAGIPVRATLTMSFKETRRSRNNSRSLISSPPITRNGESLSVEIRWRALRSRSMATFHSGHSSQTTRTTASG